MSNNLLLSIIAVIVGIFLFSRFKTSSNEGFLGNLPSMKTKVWRSVGNKKGDFYSVPGQYQSMLSPRMSGGLDLGANIRYNPPAMANMAWDQYDPLMMGDMVKESYGCSGSSCGGVASCSQTNVPMDDRGGYKPVVGSGYAAGDFNDVTSKLYGESKYSDSVSMLPVGDMTMMNSLGETIQPIVYDRITYANRNSRLRAQGDPIRGDLPIAPCNGSQWFQVSVHPQIDLHAGAMNVMGGIANSTSIETSKLMALSSAGTDTTFGGVDMSNYLQTSLGAALNDVSVSSFA